MNNLEATEPKKVQQLGIKTPVRKVQDNQLVEEQFDWESEQLNDNLELRSSKWTPKKR